jgi:hypothetical protein
MGAIELGCNRVGAQGFADLTFSCFEFVKVIVFPWLAAVLWHERACGMGVRVESAKKTKCRPLADAYSITETGFSDAYHATETGFAEY